MKNRKFFAFVIVLALIGFKYLEMWSYVLYGEYFKSLLILIFALMAFVVTFICSKKHNFSMKRVMAIAILCSVLSYLTSTINFVMAFLIAVAYYDGTKDAIKTFIKSFIAVSVIYYVITLLFYLAGVLPSVSVSRVVDQNVIMRESLGFFNANSVSLYFSPIMIAYLGLAIDYPSKKKLIITVIFSAIVLWIYTQTNSRTGFFVMVVALALFWLKSLIKNRVIKIVMKEYVILFLILSFAIAILFGQDFETPINHFLTNRPFYWYYGYVKPWGVALTSVDVDAGVALDNSYLYLLYGGGVISVLIYYIISRRASRYICDSPALMYMLIITALYGLAEQNINYCVNIIITIQLYFCIFKEDRKVVANLQDV